MIESDVIYRAQQGDGVAMAEVLQYAFPKVRAVTMRVLSPDAEALDDVIQLSLIKIWRKLDQYQDGNFDGWVNRIAQFTAYDYRRGARPGRLTSYEELEFLLSSERDLAQSFIDDAGYAATVAAIEEIPESYRSTVRLLYVEGFSLLEAAEALSLNLNTLKTRSFRGRKALAGLLRAKEESR